jgi:dTDP-4-dehydrorhamnose reductase
MSFCSGKDKPVWELWEGELPTVDQLSNDKDTNMAKQCLIKVLSMFEDAKNLTDVTPNFGPIPVGLLAKTVIQLMGAGKASNRSCLVRSSRLSTFDLVQRLLVAKDEVCDRHGFAPEITN